MWWVLPAFAAAPEVELLTMEIGDDFMSKGGHAAVCIREAGQPHEAGKCFNYGITDFSDPPKVVVDYVRGVPDFFVAAMGRSAMVTRYTKYDRTIWGQDLALSDDAAIALAAALERDLLPANRHYRYHHFENNCTSRIRDRLDEATGGLLRRDSDAPYAHTWREMSFERLAGGAVYLAAIELAGRSADEHPTLWQAMAVPDVLRDEVTKRLGATPRALYTREGPVPNVGDPRGGAGVLAAIGFHVGGLGALLGALRGRWPRVGRALMVAWLLLLALVVYGLPFVSQLSEVRPNEAALYVTPFDVALLLRGWPLRAWIAARAAMLVGVALASAVGLLVQPSLGLWPLVALPFAAGALAALRADGQV